MCSRLFGGLRWIEIWGGLSWFNCQFAVHGGSSVLFFFFFKDTAYRLLRFTQSGNPRGSLAGPNCALIPLLYSTLTCMHTAVLYQKKTSPRNRN